MTGVASLLQAAVKAALERHAPLAETLVGVFDAPPIRAATPHALIEEAVFVDWGTKDIAGREGRFAVTLNDAGEGPARLRVLAAEAEAAIAALPSTIGGGWTVASLVLLRARIVRAGEGRWAARGEWRVRLLRCGNG